MNIALWVLQVLLALAFFGHGCATPADARRDREPLWKVLEALVDPADEPHAGRDECQLQVEIGMVSAFVG